MSKKAKKMLTYVLGGIPLVLFTMFIITPLLWAVSMSFKDNSVILSGQFSVLPHPWTLKNFSYVWVRNKFAVYFFNSMALSLSSVFFIVNMVVWNGYALTRFEFRGKNVIMIVLLMTSTVPIMLNLTSIYMLIKNMGLMDTRAGIILLNIAGGLAFNTLLMRSFMAEISKELDEAALIDGCNRFQVIYRIIIPVAKPGIVTILIYAFVGCWNEYLMSFILLSSQTKFPISVGLKYFIGEFTTDYASLAAGSIIALIPPLLLFGYVQKHLVGGLTVGAVKG